MLAEAPVCIHDGNLKDLRDEETDVMAPSEAHLASWNRCFASSSFPSFSNHRYVPALTHPTKAGSRTSTGSHGCSNHVFRGAIANQCVFVRCDTQNSWRCPHACAAQTYNYSQVHTYGLTFFEPNDRGDSGHWVEPGCHSGSPTTRPRTASHRLQSAPIPPKRSVYAMGARYANSQVPSYIMYLGIP